MALSILILIGLSINLIAPFSRLKGKLDKFFLESLFIRENLFMNLTSTICFSSLKKDSSRQKFNIIFSPLIFVIIPLSITVKGFIKVIKGVS